MEVRNGAWKMFADRKTGQIAGACIVGPRADDLIHVVASIMAYGGRVRDLFEMPWYHPTLSEVILDLARGLDSKLGDGRS